MYKREKERFKVVAGQGSGAVIGRILDCEKEVALIRENPDYTCGRCALHTATFLTYLENALKGAYDEPLVESYTAEDVCCFVTKDVLGCKVGETGQLDEDMAKKWTFSIQPYKKEEFEFYKNAATKAVVRLMLDEIEPKNIPDPLEQVIVRKQQTLCPA